MKLPSLFRGRRRRHLLALSLNGLCQAAAALGFARLSADVFSGRTIASKSFFSAWPLTEAVVLLLLVSSIAVLRRRERVDAEMLGQLYVRDLRKRLFRRLLTSRLPDLAAQRRGRLLVRFIGDLNGIRQWVSLGLARLLVAGVVILLVEFGLWNLHPFFAVGVGFSLGLVILAQWWQGRKLHAAIALQRRRQGQLAGNLVEKVAALATIQVFAQNDREMKRLARQNRQLIAAARAKAAEIGALRAISELGIGLAFGSSILVTVLLARTGIDVQRDLIAVLSLVGFLGGPLRDVSRVHEYWLTNRVSLENLQQLVARLRPIPQGADRLSSASKGGHLLLRGVSVQGIFSHIDAELKPGQRIALCGENGVGKTLLLRLMARLREPDAGELLLDGHRLQALRHSDLCRRVAYVSDELPLLRGSLKYNLCYGMPQVDPDHFERVCRECGIDELAQDLPQGLDTRIEEAGANLSQGQRARVALARALMGRPDLLLLDEADAHLDTVAMGAFQRVLQEFPGGVLMATHRPEWLKRVDAIWRLQAGRLLVEDHPSSNVINMERRPELEQETA